MGRRYWVDLPPTAVTTYGTDLLELKAAAGKPIKIISVNLHQTTDFGDAQDELLSVKWQRGNTSSGSSGTAITPRPNLEGDPAASFTAEAFNTTPASGGTAVTLPRHGWNVRAPLERPYTPEEQFQASEANYLCLRLESSPADSITIGGSVCVEELA